MKKLNKYIVVTGATGGIGGAIVTQAIADGYTVIATGDKQSSLNTLQKRFVKESIIPYKINLTELDSFSAFRRFVGNKAGKIEWIIHSAGFIHIKEPLLKPNAHALRKTFLTNIESVIELTYRLLPLVTQDGGVIFISSTAGLWGNPNYPMYAASKAALNTFAQSVARHIAKNKQSSIAICPGPTNTLMRKRVAGDAKEQQSPQIVATVVTNILNRNSPYVNGDIVVVQDGIEKLHSGLDSPL